jgi:hypothetical protein
MSYVNLNNYPTLSQYAVLADQDLSANQGVGPISVNVANGYYGYQNLVNGTITGPWIPSGTPSGLNETPATIAQATIELDQLLQNLYNLPFPFQSFPPDNNGIVTFSPNIHYSSAGTNINYGNYNVSTQLIFDAGGNPNAQFLLDSSGNINLANCTFTLAGGAQSKNIFIISNTNNPILQGFAGLVITYRNNIFPPLPPQSIINIPGIFIANQGNLILDNDDLIVNLDGRLYQKKLSIPLPNNERHFIMFYGSSSTINITLSLPEPEPGPTPISNICFLGNTPIVTDQGLVLIKNIKPSVHTINNEAIVAVTRTTSIDKYLVCFEKESLGEGFPNEKTIMSKHHKVLYMGELIKAYRFVEMFENVKKVKYNGEVLYNIVMKNYRKISVNNMVCETLHPKNIIAKLYSSMFYENKIMAIEELNGCILKNDSVGYSKVVKKIGK